MTEQFSFLDKLKLLDCLTNEELQEVKRRVNILLSDGAGTGEGVVHSVYGVGQQVRPIRPTRVTFETEGELQSFIDYANSREKTNTPEMNRIREEFRNHVRSQPRNKFCSHGQSWDDCPDCRH